MKAEGSTFLLTDGLLILYATHVQLPNRRFPAANPLQYPRLVCYGLDQTFHEGGIYFQADLVTAYSCVV